MLKKKAIVYLDNGMHREHEIEAKDEADYVKWVNDCAAGLMGSSRDILIFTTPFCIYRVQNMIAVEFVDPPPPSEKLAIGFRTARRQKSCSQP